MRRVFARAVLAAVLLSGGAAGAQAPAPDPDAIRAKAAAASPAPSTPSVAPAPAPAAAPADDDIRDIRGPIALPAPLPWWPFAAGGAAALALAALALALVRRRGATTAPTALEIALARVRAASGAADAFASAVSDAVRDYLVVACALPADRRTSEELLADLAEARGASPVAPDVRPLLAALLRRCDLARFAGWELDDAARDTVRVAAVRFLGAVDSGLHPDPDDAPVAAAPLPKNRVPAEVIP
ncbi:MAG: hypothetical protein H6745_30325 [Deltaproteobacteria bacterium]|nr:hypothetical protein [Deltaproteobacteria bacterium]